MARKEKQKDFSTKAWLSASPSSLMGVRVCLCKGFNIVAVPPHWSLLSQVYPSCVHVFVYACASLWWETFFCNLWFVCDCLHTFVCVFLFVCVHVFAWKELLRMGETWYLACSRDDRLLLGSQLTLTSSLYMDSNALGEIFIIRSIFIWIIMPWDQSQAHFCSSCLVLGCKF